MKRQVANSKLFRNDNNALINSDSSEYLTAKKRLENNKKMAEYYNKVDNMESDIKDIKMMLEKLLKGGISNG